MNYTIFYDKQCAICRREMDHIRAGNSKGNLKPLPLQDHPTLLAAHGIEYDDAMLIMHMVDERGEVYSGMRAFRTIYRENGWYKLAGLLSLPGIRQFSEWFYPVFARNRYKVPAWLLPKSKAKAQCQQGQCRY